MSNLSSVLEKLQALIDSVQWGGDNQPTMLQQHAALLAFVQLSAQIKREEQQEKQPTTTAIGEALEKEAQEEEKKDDHTPTTTNNDSGAHTDETPPTLAWSSRDSLYETASPCNTTLLNIPEEYYQFARNPEHSSPLRTTLQQTLTFATWAYYDDEEILSDKLSNEDFELLQHSRATLPGHVAYYMAVSSISKKQLVVGLRGTSSLEDIVTDCCGRPVPINDRAYYYDHDRGSKWNRSVNDAQDTSVRIEVKAASPLKLIDADDGDDNVVDDHQDRESGVEVISGHERIWVDTTIITGDSNHQAEAAAATTVDDPHSHLPKCHEGIMLSAKRLVDKIQEQIEHWCVQRGYQLVLCGHSLGAGCASLAAVLLRSRLPELTHNIAMLSSTDEEEVKSRPRMHVYCFAPPPVLDREAALAASSYCTSIVNNADMIPRCSLQNLLIFLSILKGVWGELVQQGLAPTTAKTTAAFFRKMAAGTEGELLMPALAVRSLMREAKAKIESNQSLGQTESHAEPNHVDSNSSVTLATGGEAVALQNNNEASRKNPTPLYIPGVVLLAYEPWKPSASGEDGPTERHIGETDDDVEPVLGGSIMSWRVTDGTTPALNFLEIDASSRMAVDHATTSYFSLIGMKYDF